MRVVVDTNTIISAFYFPASKPRIAFDFIRYNHTLLISLDTFEELIEVIQRPKFKKYPVQIISKEFIEALSDEVERVEITERITACRDPKDDKFLEAAVAGNADIIISGDDDLTDLNPFRGIEIILAADFVERYL